MGRILAIDYGRKRVGLAISDESHIAITRLPQLETQKQSFWNNLKNIILQYMPETIVIGMPYTQTENTTNLHNEIIDFSKHIKKISLANVVFHDESYSSVEAENILKTLSGNRPLLSKKSQTKKKKELDSMAAHLILKSYIESHSSSV